MRVIHVLRKPLSEGTVASNTLKHGTGGLNINASRIASPGEEITTHTQGRGDDGYAANAVYGDYRGGFKTHQTEGQKLGRWPANVILQHLDGCSCDGVKRVRGHTGYPNGPGGKTMHYSSDKRSTEVRPNAWAGHADADGKETIANWLCEPGCPVAALDEQSGVLTTGGKASGPTKNAIGDGVLYGTADGQRAEVPFYNDTGGASRFYKQVGGKSDG